uniref:NlpC/P60 domain-containing protein n=1 Tax=Sciurus vulgaris TaxID=55149 RepID=A0A8D2BDZ3_SCIVU
MSVQILCRLLPFSPQAVTGASTTIQFFLSEAFLGQHFEAVELEQGDPEPGDLFLFRLRSPTGRWCGAHVGVYCGHGEIIHFEGDSVCVKLWTQTHLPIIPHATTVCTLHCTCSAWTGTPTR